MNRGAHRKLEKLCRNACASERSHRGHLHSCRFESMGFICDDLQCADSSTDEALDLNMRETKNNERRKCTCSRGSNGWWLLSNSGKTEMN
jgi:hypothetical protein